MEDKTFTGTLVIQNDKGLHTRPCAELVKCAANFRAQITLTYQGVQASARSILAILTLGAPKGANILIEAIGEDGQEAIQKLIELAEKKFYITY